MQLFFKVLFNLWSDNRNSAHGVDCRYAVLSHVAQKILLKSVVPKLIHMVKLRVKCDEDSLIECWEISKICWKIPFFSLRAYIFENGEAVLFWQAEVSATQLGREILTQMHVWLTINIGSCALSSLGASYFWPCTKLSQAFFLSEFLGWGFFMILTIYTQTIVLNFVVLITKLCPLVFVRYLSIRVTYREFQTHLIYWGRLSTGEWNKNGLPLYVK